MKAVVPVCVLLGACAVWGTAQKPAKTSGEEGRIIALESAWDQAEQNKDANALANLLAENLVYVDYDGSINNEGVTVHLYGNNVAVSTGIYRDRGMEKGKPFQRRGRFTNVWLNQSGKWECIASQSTLVAH